MAEYGIIVTKQNNSATIDQPVEDINFSSKFETFKRVVRKNETVPASSSRDITHALDYMPVFMIYGESSVSSNNKMLCTGARNLTDYQTFGTNYECTVKDFSGNDRAILATVFEDPVSPT